MTKENKLKEKIESLELQLRQEIKCLEACRKSYEELKEQKEALYNKQQELIKDHKNLLERYYRS